MELKLCAASLLYSSLIVFTQRHFAAAAVVDLLISSYVREVWHRFLNWVGVYAQIFDVLNRQRKLLENFPSQL